MSVEQIINFMMAPPEPAKPVITMAEKLAERILAKLEAIDPAGAEVAELRGLLSAPLVPLWAMHSVGPGEVFPMLSRERAEQEAQELRDVIKKTCGVDVRVDVIPSPWEPAEHFAILAEETEERCEAMAAELKALKAAESKSDRN